MPFANVNDINLHYEIRGTGPRLLFIHGIGADLNNPMGIFNTPVPSHFTVLAFDPRGLGQSDSPNEPCTIGDMADDAAGLAAAVGWDKYFVFGASMGGMVAQELALRHPLAVEKLILGVTNAGGENPGNMVIDKLDKLSSLEKLQLSDTRQDQTWAAAHPELVSQMEEQGRAAQEIMKSNPALMRGYNHQVNAVLKHNTFDRLNEIKIPTLVFGGRFDGSNPPDVTKALAGLIPGARYELLESGHGDWYFDSRSWEMIMDFLLGRA